MIRTLGNVGRVGFATVLIAGMLFCVAAAAVADPSRPAATPSQAVYGQVGGGDETLDSLGGAPGGSGGSDGAETLPFTGLTAALVLGTGLILLVLGSSGRALAGRLRRG